MGTGEEGDRDGCEREPESADKAGGEDGGCCERDVGLCR